MEAPLISLKRTATLGSLRVGTDSPVRVMAAVNVSPESFYKGSVATRPRDISEMVLSAVSLGAEVIDIGAMSTAPYLKNEVSGAVETERVGAALKAIKGIEVPVSVDTVRASVADYALSRGASIVNDVSGLKNDEGMAHVVKEHGASLLVMAHSQRVRTRNPVVGVRDALKETLRIAERSGIEEGRIVIDPGIGFFREEGAGSAYSPQKAMPWYRWDIEVIRDLGDLAELGRPICVALSRKSFIGKILGLDDPEERLSGSLAATAVVVANGADMVRTHDVKETVHAVRVAEALTRLGPTARRAS